MLSGQTLMKAFIDNKEQRPGATELNDDDLLWNLMLHQWLHIVLASHCEGAAEYDWVYPDWGI